MDELEALLDEVRLLWHRMVEVGERLHATEPVTLGMRAVLEHLLREGPSPVPAIARRRGVTRQHVQALVNALRARRLVRLLPNPAHRRSALVGLTPRGEELIRRMKAREDALLRQARALPGRAAVRQAAATLRAVREALPEGEQ